MSYWERRTMDKFKSDIFRYFGKEKLSLKQQFLLPPEVKYLRLLRKTASSTGLARMLLRYMLLKKQHKTQIQIPVEAEIGYGFYIGHLGRIIINPRVVIGNNVNIATGVTIDQTNRGKHRGVPTIGNRVWIGTNAVIVGGITIGDDVLIAPNAYVSCDVPSHCVVTGNPAACINRINATEGYIDNCVEEPS